MDTFLLVLAIFHIYVIKGVMCSECSIIQLGNGEDKTIIMMDSANGEVMWMCISDPGCVFTTKISLKSGSLSPLTPVFQLSDTGLWYNLTVEQVDLFVPEEAFLLVNGTKKFLGDHKIGYINVTGYCQVAWANCQIHGKCPFTSSTKAPPRTSMCSTPANQSVPTPVPYPDPGSEGAVPTLAILLVMAVLIILLLSINNCRLMMLLRHKENLNVLAIGSESSFPCKEHCKLLEKHHHRGILQCEEKKVPPKHSYQAVTTPITLVQGSSTEDLNSVIEVNSSRVPEENESPLQTSQELGNQTRVMCHNTGHGWRNAFYGSTHTHTHHIV